PFRPPFRRNHPVPLRERCRLLHEIFISARTAVQQHQRLTLAMHLIKRLHSIRGDVGHLSRSLPFVCLLSVVCWPTGYCLLFTVYSSHPRTAEYSNRPPSATIASTSS